ncbi:MAG TPA: hypothetical protein EYN60_00125 [Nitrospirales bacterium]|nr:hypothetical protein [Nitrospirales bacterium]
MRSSTLRSAECLPMKRSTPNPRRVVSHTSQYEATINRCHGSIGKAIYYTALTITLGFSILSFSNFVPTIYFGVLTGLAMVVALMSNLTLLAVLLRVFRPLGPEGHSMLHAAT